MHDSLRATIRCFFKKPPKIHGTQLTLSRLVALIMRSVRTNLTQNGQNLLCSPCVNAHELFLSSSSQESSSQSRVLSVQKRVLIFSFWMSRRCHLPQCHPRRGDATSPCWSEPIPPCSEVEIHVHFVGSVGSAARDRKAISIWLAQIVKVS